MRFEKMPIFPHQLSVCSLIFFSFLYSFLLLLFNNFTVCTTSNLLFQQMLKTLILAPFFNDSYSMTGFPENKQARSGPSQGYLQLTILLCSRSLFRIRNCNIRQIVKSILTKTQCWAKFRPKWPNFCSA